MTNCGAGAWGNPRRDGASPARWPCACHPEATSVARALAKFGRTAARPQQRPATAAGCFPPDRAGQQGRLMLLPRAQPHCQSQAGVRQLPRPESRLSAGAPVRLQMTPARAPPLRRPFAAVLPPTPLGLGCTPGLLETAKPSPSLPPPAPWRPGQAGSGGPVKDPPSPLRQQSSRAHRRPRRAAGRAAAAAAGIRGRRAGSAVPSPAGGAAAAGARARRGSGGGSVGSDPARARARTPPSLPWPGAAPPPPAAGGRQSAPLPRRLARRGSGGGRCAGGAGREVPPGGY